MRLFVMIKRLILQPHFHTQSTNERPPYGRHNKLDFSCFKVIEQNVILYLTILCMFMYFLNFYVLPLCVPPADTVPVPLKAKDSCTLRGIMDF